MNIKHLLSASILSLMLTQMSCTSQAGEGTPQQDEKTAKEVCIQLYSVRDLLKDNTQLHQRRSRKLQRRQVLWQDTSRIPPTGRKDRNDRPFLTHNPLTNIGGARFWKI